MALFCERPAIVYEVPFERLARLSQAAREQGFVAWPVGTIGREPSLRVRVPGGEPLTWTVAELAQCSGLGLKKVWNEEGV